MKVYRITPDKDCNSHIEDNMVSAIFSVEEWLKDSDKGTIVSIEILEMSQEEYDSLPEYEGP